MRSNRAGIMLAVLAALTLAACVEKPAVAPGKKPGSGSSLTNPAPIGAAVPAIVELSDMYRAPETYDVKITVLEVLRGEKAMDLIRKAHGSNAQAQSGFDYVLARLRFEFFARGAPGDKVWELAGNHFIAMSGEGKPYGAPPIAPPEPGLNGSLRSGESREGWVVFPVPVSDKKPVMTFSPGSIFFQLY